MDKLIVETRTTHYVADNHLEKYISAKLGKRVEIIGSSNDTDYSITATKEELDSWDQETINTFLDDGYIDMESDYFTIFTYFANQDWIEEGNYVLTVSW